MNITKDFNRIISLIWGPVLRSRYFFVQFWLRTFEVPESNTVPTKLGRHRLHVKKKNAAPAPTPNTKFFYFKLSKR